jgi:nucleotide-binding universal stress UspA family protein
MKLGDILVCLDPTDAGEHRLHLAATIAREHQAHLSAAYVMTEKIAGPAPYGGLGIAAPAEAAAGIAEGSLVAGIPTPGIPSAPNPDTMRGAALADIIEQRYREAVRQHAIAGDWHLFGAGEAAELVGLAKTVDLVVYGQASRDHRAPTGFRPEDIVTACGRPMLVTPYAGNFAAIGRRVLIAWDATREATRALHDALPLLDKAEAVTVITVRAREADFDRDRPGLDRVVRHLERHGIAARAEETLQGELPVSDVLLSRAADLDADLIVAGAYHHSQFREALLGGVSRELLEHMTVPVLMSH